MGVVRMLFDLQCFTFTHSGCTDKGGGRAWPIARGSSSIGVARRRTRRAGKMNSRGNDFADIGMAAIAMSVFAALLIGAFLGIVT